MAKDNTALLLIGGVVAVGGVVLLSGKKASAQSSPPALPPAPAGTTKKLEDVAEAERAYALAAAREAKRLEDERLAAAGASVASAVKKVQTAAQKKAAANVAKQKATPPTRSASNPQLLETDVENEPTPNSSAAKVDSGFVAAPIVTMPAERPAGVDLAAAKKQAVALANHIRAKGKNYTRQELALFQRRAGLVADGLYGPLSQSALKYFGAKNAPAPLSKGTIKEYTPPA